MLKLSTTELQSAQALLQHYAPAQEAIATLCHYEGDLETSLIELIAVELCTTVDAIDRVKFHSVFFQDVRQELCGNEVFRSKAIAYQKNPENGQLLVELIQDVANEVTAPIDLAMATILVLWISKLGIAEFCDRESGFKPNGV